MRAKASKPARITSQAQTAPGSYLHWDIVGSHNITTEWKNLTYTCILSSEQEGCAAIGLNLNEDNTSTEFFFDDISVEVTKKEDLDHPISFADEAVKTICVANWDTNGDGELSYGEAAAVKDLGNAFQINSDIMSFDELQYFTGLKSIGYGAFMWCSGLTSITIPSSVTSIGESVFRGCYGLTSVTIPEGVTSIGEYAFGGCYGLTSVTIPEGVTSIGDYAFTGCSGLTSVTISSSVTNIGEFAFSRCSGLTSVTISEGVKSIGSDAFSYCYNLTNVTIPSSVTSIGEYAFYGSSLTKVIVSDIAAWCGISFGGSSANPLYFAKHIYSDENTEITDLVIPSSVTSIGDYAFCNCSSLTSVTISEDVMSIGLHAFEGCSGLTSITVDDGNGFYDSRNNCNAIIETATNTLILGCLNTVIPESVTGIGDNVFSGRTDLMSVSIPEGVTSIGNYAFYGCSNLLFINLPPNLEFIGRSAFAGCANIADFNIPNTVTHIGEGAFSGTGITTLTIPKSVIEIESNYYMYSPASGCTKLESIFVEEGNPAFVSENGVLFNKDKTILMCYPAGKSDEKYIMPNTVTIVGGSAFSSNKHLTAVTLSSNLEIIGSSAFIWCSGLRDIYCYIIPDESFYDLGFGNGTNIFLLSTDLWENPIVLTLHVPVGCKQYYERWSLWNGMNIVEMEDTNIEFADANVKAICVENWDTDGDGELSYDEAAAVTDLGEVFLGWLHIGNRDITSFDELQFFTGLTSIGDLAFKGCTNLTSVTIPSSVTSIGSSAFESCNRLTSVTIPSSVTSIGSSAFSGCSSLTGVTIPLNVTSIGENAFESCSGLTSITVEEGNEVYDSRNDCNAIIETASNTLIAGCQNTVIPESVTSIGNGAFYGCSGLTSVTIPEGVTSIGNSAFKYCSGLTSISIPESVMSIGEYGFRECTGLTEVTIPGSVTAIGNYAFDLCTGLTSVTILEGVESIGELAFYGCSSLTNVTIPESVTSIDEAAFSDCISLTSITIPESVTIISKDVFSRCSGLTNVTIPSGVTTIEYRAFEDCTSLTSVTIPSSVTSIGKSVFRGCI